VNVIDYTFFQELEKLPFIEKIWLYGSRARGDAWDRSDIDIAIECPKASDADWHKVLDVSENADTLLKIDCVRLDELEKDTSFKENILEDGKLLFQRKGDLMTVPRWKQNFIDLGDALERFKEALETPLEENSLVMDGTIHRFEFCIELFWKNFKNFVEREERQVISPRDAVSQAYQMGWFDDEKMWLNMLKDRSALSHDYNKEKADDVYIRIKTYYPAMQVAYDKLKTLYDKS